MKSPFPAGNPYVPAPPGVNAAKDPLGDVRLPKPPPQVGLNPKTGSGALGRLAQVIAGLQGAGGGRGNAADLFRHKGGLP